MHPLAGHWQWPNQRVHYTLAGQNSRDAAIRARFTALRAFAAIAPPQPDVGFLSLVYQARRIAFRADFVDGDVRSREFDDERVIRQVDLVDLVESRLANRRIGARLLDL